MKIKFILPALNGSKDKHARKIKYALFPPIGLATLAALCADADEIEVIDEHIEPVFFDDEPDLVCIGTYITNAYRAYEIADTYRNRGIFVVIGGLHATTMPDEAKNHADTVITGPAENIFRDFLRDFRRGNAQPFYHAYDLDIDDIPVPRRDLLKTDKYLMSNSMVFSRGCRNKCSFCYVSSFYRGEKSYYTYKIDRIMREIETLPGKLIYFADDNIFADKKFARELFTEIKGTKKVFQGAVTVDSILDDDFIYFAHDAGFRSAFIGFESLSKNNLTTINKRSNLNKDYAEAVGILDKLGIMINGSFIFGLDGDDKNVFHDTAMWAVDSGITTATFHVLTPYPGTKLYADMEKAGRITDRNWNDYDNQHLVFTHPNFTKDELEYGFNSAYKEFYKWKNIARGAGHHESFNMRFKHFSYSAAWHKSEFVWEFLIRHNLLGVAKKLVEGTSATSREPYVPRANFRNDENDALLHWKRR